MKMCVGRYEGRNVDVGIFAGLAEHILVRQKDHVV
jgi:hypothetical protein